VRLAFNQRLLILGCLGPVRPGGGFEWYRYHVTAPANRKQVSSVGDPLHFGADPDPRIHTLTNGSARARDLEPTLDPTPFFSDFKNAKT
jgi:hypothetical protein